MAKVVLIVDDSVTVRQQVKLALKLVNLEAIEACDGVDGLAKIASNPEIGLVILDVNMPRMNGIEMLEAAKAGGKNANLPILMLSTEGQQTLLDRARKAGAKGWIVKPFKADQLVEVVKKLIAA